MRVSLILDAGALIALTRGELGVRARLREAATRGVTVFVPPIAVTQVLRGGPRDAPLNRALKNMEVPPVGLSLAREAGRLLGRSGLRDAADAQIAAEALLRTPCEILTSDPDDIGRLIDGEPGVEITAI